MQERMFLKLDGIKGESQSPRHIGEIEISGFSWGEPNGVGTVPGGAGGKGKASFTGMTIFKRADKTSPFLKLASAEGRHFKDGAVTIEKVSATGGLLHSLIIRLESILIGFVSYSGGPDYDMETVELNFASKKFAQS